MDSPNWYEEKALDAAYRAKHGRNRPEGTGKVITPQQAVKQASETLNKKLTKKEQQ